MIVWSRLIVELPTRFRQWNVMSIFSASYWEIEAPKLLILNGFTVQGGFDL